MNLEKIKNLIFKNDKDAMKIVSLLDKEPKYKVKYLKHIFISIVIIIFFNNIFISTSNGFIAIVTLIITIAVIIKYWTYILKLSKSKESKTLIIRQLRYFLELNNLFLTDYRDVYKNDRWQKEKYVSYSALLGYKLEGNTLLIRAYKRGDSFNSKMNNLDDLLSSLFGVPLDNKKDNVKYCDYYFNLLNDKRIVVEQTTSSSINTSTYIPLSSNLKWNVAKQPHLLLAGVTGSGKTYFLNYLILEFKRMSSQIYICDPKRSDLASLKHIIGSDHVASDTNNIARLTRIAREEMENRYIEYKENIEKAVYGYSYVEYELNPIVIIFDELGAFRASADKKIFSETMNNLTEIILKGREMGVFCVLSTQQPNANNIPTELRDNLSVRIALGNMSMEAFRMVFGDSLSDITGSGSAGSGFIFLDGLGWARPKPFETPYIDFNKFNFIDELKKMYSSK